MKREPLIVPMLVLLGVLAVSMIVAIAFGTAPVSLRSLLDGDATVRAIIFRLRVPRVCLAAVIGATLGIAGVTFQTLLRNPLADPFILGVSGGAACGAAIATVLGLGAVPGVVPAIAFAGACAATLAVFALARRRDHTDPVRLLLSGLVLNALFSSLILIAFAFATQSDLTAAVRWMMGTLSGATWNDVALVGAFFVAAFIVLFWMANDLRMLAFGEEDARSRGVDVERVKLAGFLAASIVTGAAVAVSGIIGFIGLIVPNLVRLAWRRDFRALLPLSALAGATLVVLSDLVSRVAVRSAELPISAFTAVIGVPFFLSLLRKAR